MLVRILDTPQMVAPLFFDSSVEQNKYISKTYLLATKILFINASIKDVLLIFSSCHWLAEVSETIFNWSGAGVNMAIKESPYCCHF